MLSGNVHGDPSRTHCLVQSLHALCVRECAGLEHISYFSACGSSRLEGSDGLVRCGLVCLFPGAEELDIRSQ